MKMTGVTERLKKLLEGDRKVKLILAIGLAGMLLILIAQLTDSGGTDTKQNGAPSNPVTAEYTTEEYAQNLESRLQNLICSIEGVGQAQVMVTLEHGVQNVYAQQEKSSMDKKLEPQTGDTGEKLDYKHDVEYSYVFVDTGYGEKQPLLTTQLPPKVQGVVVVCEGAKDVRVQESVIGVVTTALNISSTRVCVVKIDTK